MENYLYSENSKKITRKDRENLLKQNAKVIWITGLSASGKSTLAYELEQVLFSEGKLVQVLDGDQVRYGLNRDLSFSIIDREENIRRIAELAKILADTGIIVICSFISPTKKIRAKAKAIIGEQDFVEVFVDTPIEVCELRDPKGLYAKARKREITNFTGVDAPYEAPEFPDIRITHERLPEISAKEIRDLILK